jgi:hypothetical protein
VHGRLQAEFNERKAVLLRGRVTKVERDGDIFRLIVSPRGSSQAEVMTTDPLLIVPVTAQI